MAKIHGDFKTALKDEYLWNIACGLRGPDGSSKIDSYQLRALKDVFTARIRAFVGARDRQILSYTVRETPGIYSCDLKAAFDAFCADTVGLSHYIEHANNALEAMLEINIRAKKKIFGSNIELRFLIDLTNGFRHAAVVGYYDYLSMIRRLSMPRASNFII